jgi:hypothetical protein
MKKNKDLKINKEDINGYIFTNFVRSFDKYHNSNNRMHLISSVVFLPKAIITDDTSVYFTDFWDLLSSSRTYSDQINNIVVVIENSIVNDGKNYKLYIERENLNVYVIGLDDLCAQLKIIDNGSGILVELFGSLSLKNKDLELCGKNCLFIFEDICWSNVVLKFKLNGIDISGGSLNKRHILSTVHFSLFMNILKFFQGNESLINSFIFNSNKSPVLSPTIPLILYNKYIEETLNYKNLKIENIHLKYEANLNNQDRNFFNIIVKNYNLAFNTLFQSINKKSLEHLNFLKENLIELKSELKQLEYNIDIVNNLRNSINKYTKNKTKKLLKKQITALINDPLIYKKNETLLLKINKTKERITNLEKKICIAELEFSKLELDLKNKTFNELNELNNSLP